MWPNPQVHESTQIYQGSLNKSGYDHHLTYQKSINNKNQIKQRKRKLIWFNPPMQQKCFNKSRESIPKNN